MECSILDYDFPFVARKEQLIDNKMGLDATMEPNLMFLNWFIGLSRQNQKVRLCPDILYLTYNSGKGKGFMNISKLMYYRVLYICCLYVFQHYLP